MILKVMVMNLYWWFFTISQYSSIINETLKVLDDFKNKQKNVRGDVFWYVKVHIFWKCILYTIDWDLNTIVKKISSDKINGTKNAPNYHSFTFDLWFLNELKRKVCLSKKVWGISHFRFLFIFINVYIFV